MTNSFIPGYDVAFGEAEDRRFGEPSPSNLFFVGTSLKGTVHQGHGIGQLLEVIGDRQNWSGIHDDAFSAIAESNAAESSLWTFARPVGPGAEAASVTISDGTNPSIKVTAKSPGPWINGAVVAVTTPSTGKRRLTVTLAGETLVTSPALDLVGLGEFGDDEDNNVIDVEVLGTQLPQITGTNTLAGGDDDRANIDVTSWQAAFDLCEKRYGPGLFFVDSTDPDVIAAARAHCAYTNRVPFFKTDRGESIEDLIEAQDEMRADDGDHAHIGGTFAGYAYTRPISTEPKRRASAAAVQMGNQSRILRDSYVRKTAFGPDNAPLVSVIELDQEFTEQERNDLYAAGVNVLVDDGGAIATWGYATGSLDRRHQDLHHQIVRMALRWEVEAPLRATLGQQITKRLKSTTQASVESILDDFVEAGAIDAYRVDVDRLNTNSTAAARQFFAELSIRHTGTVEFARVLVVVNAPDAATLA